MEPERGLIAVEIKYVGGPRPVDVGQAEPSLLELVRQVENRCGVHRNLSPKSPITQVGPVANFSVADSHDVGKSITGKIREVYRLRTIRKDQCWAFVLVERFCHPIPLATSSTPFLLSPHNHSLP